ncbi:MAG: M20/M25/M40 family metallo-hydrolase [Acidobacteriota bacterium]
MSQFRKHAWEVFRRFPKLAMVLALSIIPGMDRADEIDWNRVRQEAAGYLSRYIAIDTLNPPGRTVEAAEFLGSILESAGIPVEKFDSGDGRVSLLARLEGTRTERNPLVLLHHMDIVPADPDLWSHPPLGGETDNGYIWGRGAVDMKGMGILELMAMILVKRQGLDLNRDLVYLAVPDEETGGQHGTGWMTENHWDRLDPEYVWDEGLTGTRNLFSDRSVVWGISVAEKKVLWLRLIVEGTGGHGSQPHADNPVDFLVRSMARLSDHDFPVQRSPVVTEIFDRLGEPLANKFTNSIQRNTCSLTTLTAGMGDPPKVNVIPSRAEATIDCRILPDVSPSGFLDQLKDILGREHFASGRMRIETIQEAEPVGVVTSFDSELFRIMKEVAEAEREGSVAIPVQVPWGTDSRYFRERGVKAYGFIPIILEPGELARMHGVDERISVENLELGTRLMYRILERFLASG